MGLIDAERLIEAAETGEMLVVVYMAGHAPGFKRRISVIDVDVDSDHLTVKDRGKRKTYLLSKTTVVYEGHPAPWMPEDAGKTTPVDPVLHFADWAFEINKWHYEALGVILREVVDKEMSDAARTKAMVEGMPKTEATKRFKFMRFEYAIYSPMAYSFSVGDIFYRGTQGGSDFAQVSRVTAGKAGIIVEVHWPIVEGRRSHIISASEFADCLKFGRLPGAETRIDKLHSIGLMSFRPAIADFS